MYLLIGVLLLGCVAAAVSPRDGLLSTLWSRIRARISRAQALQPVRVDDGWTVIPGDDEASFRDWVHEDDFKRPTHPGIEPALGSHLLIELYGCDSATLEAEEYVRAAMEDAAVRSNATVVTSSFHEFKPYGVSGAVIIQESHYTIHTWPEHEYAAIDLFYCGDGVAVDRAVETLQKQFRPSRTRFLVVRRGLQSEVGVR